MALEALEDVMFYPEACELQNLIVLGNVELECLFSSRASRSIHP